MIGISIMYLTKRLQQDATNMVSNSMNHTNINSALALMVLSTLINEPIYIHLWLDDNGDSLAFTIRMLNVY